jgi:hypothetical protein
MLYSVIDKPSFSTTTEYLTHLIAEERRELGRLESFAAKHRDRVAQLEEALRAVSPPVVFQQASSCSSDCCSAETKPAPDSDGPVIETCEVHVDCRPAQQHIAKFARELQAALAPLANFDVPKP